MIKEVGIFHITCNYVEDGKYSCKEFVEVVVRGGESNVKIPEDWQRVAYSCHATCPESVSHYCPNHRKH